MKQFILSIASMLILCNAMAQTDFRNLNYEQAVQAAKAEHKMVLMDFYTQWCAPCKMMAREVFPQPQVGDYLNQRFVCLKLDAEKEGKALARRFKVMFYPTFIGVDTTGKEVLRIEGGTDAATFVAHVDRLINPEKMPERVKARYESGERNAELVYLYASQRMAEARKTRQGDPAKKAEAFRAVKEYFDALSDAERVKAENLFMYTEYVESPLDDRAAYMVANESRFADPAREQIRACIERLYGNYLGGYFSGKIPFNKTDYETIRRNAEALGLNRDHRYDLLFRFIECHATSDLSAYFDFAAKEYEHLPEVHKTAWIHGLPLLLQNGDTVLLKRALQFVRSHLAGMPLNTLHAVSDVLFAFENKLSAPAASTPSADKQSSGQTNFRHLTYEQAIAAAKAENKLLFIDFYTQWCGPCKAMLRNVFPQKIVGDYLNKHFVCIKLDAEKEGKELAERYKVNAYPTFVGIDAQGKEVMRKVGGGTAESFLAAIEQQINPNKTPARLSERYQSGERTPELIKAYAALKMQEAGGEMMNSMENYWAKEKEVIAMVKDYFDGLNEKERLSSDNLFIYMQYVRTPLDEMAQYMVAHRKQFDRSIRPRISAKIAELYRVYLLGCFTSGIHQRQEDYARVKKETAALGLNKDEEYNSVFRFIECYSEGNMEAYLDLCEKDYGQLPSDFRTTLLTRIPALIRSNDPALLKRTALFMRNHLAELTPPQLYTIVMSLSQLESSSTFQKS